MGLVFSIRRGRGVHAQKRAMATGIRFKKLVEEEERLGDESERDEDDKEEIESQLEIIALTEDTMTANDLVRVERRVKKCKNPFNSVAAVVIAIGVFGLTVLISFIVVLFVSEPPPPFYPGEFSCLAIVVCVGVPTTGLLVRRSCRCH